MSIRYMNNKNRHTRSARPGVPTLVVDANAQPLAWTRGVIAPDGEVATDPLGVSFVPTTDTLRDALEAVLTSPTGLGVAVGEHGRYLGVVDADAIRTLDLRYRAEAAEARAEQAYQRREAERQAAEHASSEDDPAGTEQSVEPAAEAAPVVPEEQTAPAVDAEAPDESQRAAES